MQTATLSMQTPYNSPNPVTWRYGRQT